MTQDKFVRARRKKEAYRGTPTDDNADRADLDKSNAQVIDGQFLTIHGLRRSWQQMHTKCPFRAFWRLPARIFMQNAHENLSWNKDREPMSFT